MNHTFKREKNVLASITFKEEKGLEDYIRINNQKKMILGARL